MTALIRLCRCNRLICAFDVRKGIKQVFLWPGFIYFYCLQGWAKGAHVSPPPPPTRHCRIMNDFFFWRSVVVEGHGNLSPPPLTSTPPNPFIFVWVWWLKGQAGYPGNQTSRNYFLQLRSYLHIRRKVLFVLEFYGPVNTI